MPHAQIFRLEGPAVEQKKAVIEEVTAALQRALDDAVHNMQVWIHDMPKENRGIAGVTAKNLGR